MGFLKATMMAKVLQHVKNHDEIEKRRKILKWIWDGDYWEIHKSLQQERVEGTGDWLLNTDAYKKWLKGESIFLICPGIRMKQLTIRLISAGAGKSFLTYESSGGNLILDPL
jgi:hypothetical protein